MWTIVFGRVGSHVALAGFYVTDLILLFSFLSSIVVLRHQSSLLFFKVPKYFLGAWAAFAGLLVIHTVVSLNSKGVTSLDFAINFAPYLYLICVPTLGLAVAALGREFLELSHTLILWSLRAHAMWFAAKSLLGHFLLLEQAAESPFPTYLLAIRSDFDGAILIITAGVHLFAITTTRKNLWTNLVVAGGSLLLIDLINSRAAMIAGILATLLLVTVLHRESRGTLYLAPVGVLALFFFFFTMTLSLSGPSGGPTGPTETTELTNVLGNPYTALARMRAWEKLVAWIFSSPGRFFFGTGLSSSFMSDSGAELALVGADSLVEARAPHNWILSVFAHLGLVGVAILALFILSSLKTGAITATSEPLQKLGFTFGLGVLSLFVVSLFGVVLETPFGMVPFATFLGLFVGRKLAL